MTQQEQREYDQQVTDMDNEGAIYTPADDRPVLRAGQPLPAEVRH